MRFVFVLVVLASLSFAHGEVNDVSTNPGNPGGGIEGFLDELFYIDVEALGASNRCVGVGFDGTNLWVTDGANSAGTGDNMLWIITPEGTLVTSVMQNATTGWGLRDLCCDGTYMYGSQGTTVDYYDISTYEKVGAYTCSAVNPNRAEGYDGTYFYTGSFTETIYQVTWDGVSGSTASTSVWSTAVVNGGTYGAAWDYWNDCMWVSTASGDYQFYQIDPSGTLITAHSYMIATAGGCTQGLYDGDIQTWVLEQATPDGLRCLETHVALDRDTWGSIKTLF